jgi:hypothetical protein
MGRQEGDGAVDWGVFSVVSAAVILVVVQIVVDRRKKKPKSGSDGR